MRKPGAIQRLLLLPAVLCLSGCWPTLYVPKLQMQRIEVKLHPGDPVFSGPGGAGPIWSVPEVTMPGCGSCGSCESGCCPPSTPHQPIDPFGWMRSGSAGTHVVDPVGWMIGI